MKPRYPVYIPSKGRYERATALTAQCLMRDGVDFRLVVEKAEVHHYEALVGGADRLLVLPFSNQGLMKARNWIKDHAISEGHLRHWQLDDNMKAFYRVQKGYRYHCRAGIALRVAEDFTDRYTNIAISGLEYKMFGIYNPNPFVVNARVYSCTLVNNVIPHRWRLRYNDDTDMCLQVLADGWCTVLFYAFLVDKIHTMQVKGGNTADLYGGDGRLKMARMLERHWPGVVETKRRFQRPQHVVKDSWKRFDTKLIRDQRVAIPTDDPYAMELKPL